MEDRHPDQESGHLGSSLSDAPDFAGQLQASHVPSQDLSSSCVKGGPDALMSTVPPGRADSAAPAPEDSAGGEPAPVSLGAASARAAPAGPSPGTLSPCPP